MTCRTHILLASFVLGISRLAAAELMTADKPTSMTAATDAMKMPTKSEILASYVKISAALAADNLTAAKTAAATVAEQASGSDYKDIAAKANALVQATKIVDARGAFRELSFAVEPLAAGEKDYVVMYCPMAESDWIQLKGKTQNPYLGRSMPRCGSPKKSK